MSGRKKPGYIVSSKKKAPEESKPSEDIKTAAVNREQEKTASPSNADSANAENSEGITEEIKEIKKKEYSTEMDQLWRSKPFKDVFLYNFVKVLLEFLFPLFIGIVMWAGGSIQIFFERHIDSSLLLIITGLILIIVGIAAIILIAVGMIYICISLNEKISGAEGEAIKKKYTPFGITSDTTSEYYYVGKTKDNRPDGFGMIFGMSTGSGTYALADGFMIHYIGDFKNGAYDGFGALFSADEYDLSGMINNIVQSGEITSDEVLENAVEYLFNYVSYEGHFKDGKMNGKGNEFSFPNVEVGLPFDFNNDPIDGYRYYNIYPDVIMGEYKNNALTGMVKEYWHNHLWYSGEMDDGQESGKGAWYYNNGQVMYEGEFKKGKQSGKGSYYDENGNLIYSGEWENGDYAH